MTSKHYELIFGDKGGRAEDIRIFLHAAGTQYTDTRITRDDWPAIKGTTPLGQVPVLKIDGEQHCQSVALKRFTAKLAGFYPEDPFEALVVDEVVESIQELISKIPRTSKDAEELKKLRTEFQSTTMKQYADFIESFIQKNDGCLVIGKTVSTADLEIRQLVESVENGTTEHLATSFFDEYPGMTATAKAAAENSKVKAYYESLKS